MQRAQGDRRHAALGLVHCLWAGLCRPLGPLVEVIVSGNPDRAAQSDKSMFWPWQTPALRTGLPATVPPVAMIVSRDTAGNDAALSPARNRVAAEICLNGVGGPVVLVRRGQGVCRACCFYKITNTADSMIGYTHPAAEAFGWAAARF